jgi:hypothetical protein
MDTIVTLLKSASVAAIPIGAFAYFLSFKYPDAALVLFFFGIVVVILIRLNNLRNEREAKRYREDKERERIKAIQERFKELRVKLITNSEHQPFAFRSVFDTTHKFSGKAYSYPKIGELYFVVNGIITPNRDVEVITEFIEEFYSFGPQRAMPSKKPICIIEESQDSLVEKARVAKEKEAERQRILKLVLTDIYTRTKEDVGEMGSALYIMFSEFAVKIGISDEPEKRLGEVQTGHPAKLALGKVIWFFSRMDAALVEKTTHAKLHGAHASGEWFNVKFAEAADAVAKIVSDLIQNGQIDSHRVEIDSKNASTDLERRIAELISREWRISKKGKEWLKLGDKSITIFPQKSRWSYVCAGERSNGSFSTKKEAKIAALQLYIERYGDPT